MNQKGYTLIEIMVVVVIIGIISAYAITQMVGTRRAQTNMMQSPRLTQYMQIQEKYKSTRGHRSYGTLKELCKEKLLPDTVVKMSADCNTQTAINGWIIVPGDETAAFLQHHFFAVLKFESRPSNDTYPIFCGGEDGVPRQAAASSIDVCTSGSTPLAP